NRSRVPAHLCKAIFGKSGFDLLLAIEDRINLAILLDPRVVAVEGLIDCAEYDVKWDTGVFPAFDEGPVQSRDQHMLPAPADELLLDLGEIVEVVQPFGRSWAAVGVGAFQWWIEDAGFSYRRLF